MRPALYVGLTAALLLGGPSASRAGGARANGSLGQLIRAVARAAAEAQPALEPPRAAAAFPAPRDDPRPEGKPAPPLFVAEAVGYGLDPDSAQKNGWQNASVEVANYLELHAPDVHWTPTPAQLQQRKMARDVEKPFQVRFDDKKDKDRNPFDVLADAGVPWFADDREREAKPNYFGARVRIELTAEHLQALREEARGQLVQQRQRLAGLALAGIMALLAVVGGYLRLEEKTRGFYTGLLRAAAAALLALVGVGLWMMS